MVKRKQWSIVEELGTQNPDVSYSTIIDFYLDSYATKKQAKKHADKLLKAGRKVRIEQIK